MATVGLVDHKTHSEVTDSRDTTQARQKTSTRIFFFVCEYSSISFQSKLNYNSHRYGSHLNKAYLNVTKVSSCGDARRISMKPHAEGRKRRLTVLFEHA